MIRTLRGLATLSNHRLGRSAIAALVVMLAGNASVAAAASGTKPLPAPPLAWSPASGGSYAMATNEVGGAPVTQTFTLTNSGKKAVGPLTAGLAPGGSSAFAVSGNTCQGATITSTCSVTVTWTPANYAESDTATLSAQAGTGSKAVSASLSLTGSTASCGAPVAIIDPPGGAYGPGPLPIDATQSYVPSPCASAPVTYYWQCTSLVDPTQCPTIESQSGPTDTSITYNLTIGETVSFTLTVCFQWPAPGAANWNGQVDCSYPVTDVYQGIPV